MALVEHLIAKIPDAALRKAIEREVTDPKKRLTWGLVFERHTAETTLLLDAPVRPGSVAWKRPGSKAASLPGPGRGTELVVVPEAEGEAAPARLAPMLPDKLEQPRHAGPGGQARRDGAGM
jgi:hypothetical protein